MSHADPSAELPAVAVATGAEMVVASKERGLRTIAAGEFFVSYFTTALEVSLTYDGGEGGWSGGTHCAEVEVDTETGLVRILAMS